MIRIHTVLLLSVALPVALAAGDCVHGVCQITSFDAVTELFKMNNPWRKSVGDYFWSIINPASGKFVFAGDTDVVGDFAKVKEAMRAMPEQVGLMSCGLLNVRTC